MRSPSVLPPQPRAVSAAWRAVPASVMASPASRLRLPYSFSPYYLLERRCPAATHLTSDRCGGASITRESVHNQRSTDMPVFGRQVAVLVLSMAAVGDLLACTA